LAVAPDVRMYDNSKISIPGVVCFVCENCGRISVIMVPGFKRLLQEIVYILPLKILAAIFFGIKKSLIFKQPLSLTLEELVDDDGQTLAVL